MDKLKQFIDNHWDEFENDSLPEGHLDRFEAKLKKEKGRTRKLALAVCFLTAAAVLVLLLLIRPTIEMPESGEITCESAQEIREVRLYYQMQMGEVVARMETIYQAKQAPGAADLLHESKQILSENQSFEEEVLPTLPCSNDGLYAMTQHYNNSLESLNIMLNQMERVTSNYTNNKKER